MEKTEDEQSWWSGWVVRSKLTGVHTFCFESEAKAVRFHQEVLGGDPDLLVVHMSEGETQAHWEKDAEEFLPLLEEALRESRDPVEAVKAAVDQQLELKAARAPYA